MIAVSEARTKGAGPAEMLRALREVKAALKDGRPIGEAAGEVEMLAERLRAAKGKHGRLGEVQLSPYMTWALVRVRRGRVWED